MGFDDERDYEEERYNRSLLETPEEEFDNDFNEVIEERVELQEIFTIVSYKRDHAAVWTLMQLIPNDPGSTSDLLIQARDGQWYLLSRDLFNTNEQARKSVTGYKYTFGFQTVVYLDNN